MTAGPQPLSVREGYDRWAEVYDGDGNPLIAVEEPVFDRLLGPVGGRAVLDVGCGTGRHTRRLADRGARVTGVDLSSGMLARARAKTRGLGVGLVRQDVGDRLPFAGAVFDLVVSGLVLDHVTDLVGLFVEMRRVCRPGGRVVVSTVHPAMALRGVQARFIEPSTGARVPIESARHSIADYVNAVLAAGLRLDRIEEHAVDAAVARSHPRGEPYLGWPILLAMACTAAVEPGHGAAARGPC